MNITISCKDYVIQEKEKIKEKTKNKEYVLHIFQVGDEFASNTYVKNKMKDCDEVGIKAILHKYPEDDLDSLSLYADLEDVDHDMLLNDISGGIFLQLPVPEFINLKEINERISPWHDVDGFKQDSWYKPCTPSGIIDWLEVNNVDLCGKNVCIIGRSDIVGKPLAQMMIDKDATVTLCHSKTVNLEEHMKMADIIVAAVGKAKFIHDINLPKKPIVIDVGINRDENGKLCGDVDYENMLGTCSYITPVPGGIGTLTRVALLKNITRYTKEYYTKSL